MTGTVFNSRRPAIILRYILRWRSKVATYFVFFVSLSFCPGAEPTNSPGNVTSTNPAVVLPKLTSIKQVRQLTPDQAKQAYPVEIRGVVTYSHSKQPRLFVQDATSGIFVFLESEIEGLKHGTEIEVAGVSRAGRFAPWISKPTIRVMGPGKLPEAKSMTLDQVLTGQFGSQWIEVQGVVRSVVNDNDMVRLDLIRDGVQLKAWVAGVKSSDELQAKIVDGLVRLRGVTGPRFDSKSRFIGYHLLVPDRSQIVVETPPPADPFQQPIKPISELLGSTSNFSHPHRTKVEGVVSKALYKQTFCITDGTEALFVRTRLTNSLSVGDKVEVAGFPTLKKQVVELQEALFRKTGQGQLPDAVDATGQQLLSGDFHGRLVSIKVRLIDRTVHQNREITFVSENDGVIFPALLQGPESQEALFAIRDGSTLQLTGVCSVDWGESETPQAFMLLLRTPADVAVLATPSWWNLKHTVGLLGTMALFTGGAMIWNFLLRKRVREKTELIRQKLESEAALEERYKELFENASDFVYTHDLNGAITSANRASERILGYSHEELCQLNGFDLVAPEYRSLAKEMLNQKLRNAASTTYEMEFISKSGARVSVEVNTRIIRQNGIPVGIHGIARDVTERKRAEQALRQSEYKYRALTEASPAGIWQVTPAGETLFMNSSMHALLELDPSSQCTPRHIFDYCAEYNKTQIRAELAKGADGFASTFEIQIIGEKGGQKNVIICGAPLSGENGMLQSFIITLTDVTEKNRTERALRDSQEHYRYVVEGSIQGIMIHQDSVVQFANRSFARIFGFESHEEVIGKNIWDSFVCPEDWVALQSRTNDCVNGEPVPIHHGWRGRRRDGSRIWVQSAASTIKWKGRAAVLAFFIDVTERRQAEEALRRSEERFSKAFRSSPVPITISTLVDGEYIDANESFLRMMGYTRNELVGELSLRLGIWADPKDRARLVQKLQKERSVRDAEYKFRTKSGEIRTALLSAELFDLAGELCILVSFNDITEQQQLEAALRHAQKLEAVGQLAAGVAHDFNNIMTIIQGHASLLLANQTIPRDMMESLRDISNASDRAANLTRQLLTFSRKQLMQTTVVDINEVIGNTVKMLQRLLGENVVLQCQYSALPTVMADAGMLEQVIINLAVNARDAMPKGGKLTISTAAVEINENSLQNNPDARSGRYACLVISDTGIGMNSDVLAKIYEPFFTTKGVGKGTGLGLSMVYGIVKQHQGWIEVNSTVNVGTTFRLFFPALVRSEPVSKAPPAAVPIRGGTEKILVVEDEPALRELVCTVLQRYGYRVVTACSGKDALSVWRQENQEFDLLVTDVIMPDGLSGKELADILLADKPGFKVILASGYSLDTTDPGGLEQQGFHFLQKPFQPRKLAEMVRNCLDGIASPAAGE